MVGIGIQSIPGKLRIDPSPAFFRVLKLLDNRGLASEFGMEGRRRIETSFSLDTMTNAYLGLYRRVADRRARAT